MGKSPGKWIKTVLLGKKSSKSNLSKNAKLDENTASKTPADNLIGNSPVVSDPCQFTDIGASNMELEKGTSGNSHCANVNQGVNSQRNFPLVTTDDAEMKRQDQAATKAQAAFRGYLARRAFRALKGIIRLQALIRGHLVRRQAVATLRCMHAIIKFQALARGLRVRLSNTSPKMHQKYMIRLQDAKQMGSNSIFESEKLATNAFVRKLLLSLPTSTPLSLQYELAEPNSAWSWLERWSLSHFWVPPQRPKKAINMKPLKKKAGSQVVETEAGKSKRSIRKAPDVENGALASHEMDKPKRNPRKITSHQTELLQEQPQYEQEGVRRSSRKKSAFEKSDMETESNSVTIDVSEEKIVIFSEKTEDSCIIDKRAFLESPSNITNDPSDEKMENMPFSQEELSSKDEEICKDNQKIRKRRSLPSKHEHVENISQKNSSLPSYMAATQSAKAKLRAQIANKFSEDGPEHGYIRRHSLPASTNGKSSSLSPRIQGNGKGGSKTNKFLTSSKDDKIGWRR